MRDLDLALFLADLIEVALGMFRRPVRSIDANTAAKLAAADRLENWGTDG
jgi:hypothetical protein